MFSTVSSYLMPAPSLNPLDIAMRNGDFGQLDALVKEGSSPAELTTNGLTVIDNAIFQNQVKNLPRLITGAGSDEVVQPKISAGILAYSKTLEFKRLNDNLSKINPENLDNEDSPDSKMLKTVLDTPISLTDSKGQGFQAIHLIAMSAKPAVLKAALDLNPDLINSKDAHGNTPLHYSAFNTDQEAFVGLVRAGANIFAKNEKSETPIGNLVALAQLRDPLQWDYKDIFMFLSDWIPVAIASASASGYVAGELAVSLKDGCRYMEIAAYMTAFYTVIKSTESKLAKGLFTGASLALLYQMSAGNPLIELRIGIAAFATYKFAKRAFNSIKSACKYYGSRPLKGTAIALIRASNAYSQLGNLRYLVDLGKALRAINKGASRFSEFDIIDVPKLLKG